MIWESGFILLTYVVHIFAEYLSQTEIEQRFLVLDKSEAAPSCWLLDVPGFIGMHISKKVLKAASADGIAHIAVR